MRWGLAVLFAMLPVAAGAQPAPSSQAPGPSYVGRTVLEVHLATEGRPVVGDETLSDLVDTRIGQPLSMAAVRSSISLLFSLGRFENVRVDATEVPGGVRLDYDLVPLHSVARVDFRGTLGVSEGVLRKAVSDQFGAQPSIGRAPEVVRTLEQQVYPQLGYLGATVRWKETREHDPDRTILTFEVDSGPRARIGTVEIHGDPREPAAAFKKQIDAVEGMPYAPAGIRRGIEDYLKRMRSQKRYEASATFVPNPSDDGALVNLRVDVDPGPVVTVAFQGDPLPKDKLGELVPLEREGSVNEDLVEDSARRISQYFQQQGYFKAVVAAERRAGEGTLTVVFSVRKGLQYHVAEGGLEIVGNNTVPLEHLPPLSPALQPGRPFLKVSLDGAASSIRRRYLELGFPEVKVDSDPRELSSTGGSGLITPVIVINEGPRTLVGDVTFENNSSLSEEALRAKIESRRADPYYEPMILRDRDAILLEYLNTGFWSAEVAVRRVRSADKTRLELTFSITEGVQTIVDHILIVGNVRTNRRVIERELLLKPGQPLGLEDRVESQRRLGALGLFRRIRIAALSSESAERRDVLITVEEAAATTLSYGGGLEFSRRLVPTGPSGEARERSEFAPRGFFDIGRRNIGGKNRSVNLFTRVSLRPDVPTLLAPDAGGFGFSDYRIVGTYREPKAIGAGVDLTLTGAVEQGIRSSFNFARKGVTAEVVQRLSRGVRGSARYSFSTTRTFDEQLSEADQTRIDRIFPRVRLSAFAGAISRDTRDDVLEPGRGMFVSAEGTLATRALGGQVGFIKSYVQGLWFRRLPGRRQIVFASRAAVGLADGFPRIVTSIDPDGQEVVESIEDLPASERFFAGGDTTIRGFALDTVGAPNTISANGFPKGGNAVLILNGELRVPVWGGVGAAFFVDGGNVFDRVTEFDVGELRGSAGFGIRYRSPIGPVRFDIGFKLDRREIGGQLEPRRGYHFSIGQAF